MTLEEKGVPTVMVVTDKFEKLARFEAEARGRPFIRLVVVPHPIGGMSKEEIEKKAEAALEEIIGQATR